MTSDEVVALVKKNDGELCGLVTRRHDGTLLTSDRRPKRSRRSKPRQFKIGGLMAFIACPAPVFGVVRFFRDAMQSRVSGAVRVGCSYPGSAAQYSEVDPDEEPDREGCLDEPASDEPTPSRPGA